MYNNATLNQQSDFIQYLMTTPEESFYSVKPNPAALFSENHKRLDKLFLHHEKNRGSENTLYDFRAHPFVKSQ